MKCKMRCNKEVVDAIKRKDSDGGNGNMTELLVKRLGYVGRVEVCLNI